MSTGRPMSIARIEKELTAAQERIKSLETQIIEVRQWQSELTTSLSVLHRLNGGETDDIHDEHSPEESKESPNQRASKRSGRRLRSDVVTRAETALIELLRERGDNIRQVDAVKLLREQYEIVVGLGKPGRETSDLSASLGKSPHLSVNRTQGWRLVEWGDKTKAERDAIDAEAHDHAAEAHHHDNRDDDDDSL